MATNSSEHLGLHLWQPTDQVLRTEFNQNWSKIDEAVAEVQSGLTDGLTAINADLGSAGKNARIAWGTYTGTGIYGAANPTGLTFDFYPVMVWVGCENCAGSQSWPSAFIRGCPASHPDVTPNLLTVTWTDNGVSWYDTRYSHGQLQNNDQGVTYYYCVLGYDKNAENG